MASAAPLDLGPIYQAAGQEWNVDPALLQAVAAQESGATANPDQARSPKGAMGRMQLMPGTASDMGVTDPSDPVQSIYGGAKYLSQQLDKYPTPELALAAYNAGPNRVDDHLANGTPLPAETVAYIPGVTRRYQALAAPQQPPAASGDGGASQRLDQAMTDLRQPGTASPTATPAAAAAPSGSDPFAMAWSAARSAGGTPGNGAPAVPGGQGGAPASPPPATASDPFAAAWTAARAAAVPSPAPGGPPAVPAPVAGIPQPATPVAAPTPSATSAPGFLNSVGQTAANFAEGAGHAVLDASHGLYGILNRAEELAPGLNGLDRATGINPPAALANLDAEAARYQASGVGDTLAGKAGGLTGQTVLTVPALGLAGKAAAYAGNALTSGAEAVSPAVGRAAGAVNRLMAGTATSDNALMRPIVRGASLAANGATQGAAVNALTGNPDDGVLRNALTGAALGGTIGPAAGVIESGLGRLGSAAAGLVQPFTTAGRGAIADTALARMAMGGPLAVNDSQLVAGSTPTLAQAMANPGLAGAERAVAGVRPNQFADKATQNNEARGALVDSLRGTSTDIEGAELSRDAAAVPAITGPLNASATPASAQPVVDTIDGILASPAGQRDAVQSALGNIRGKLVTPVPLADRVGTALDSVNQAITAGQGNFDPALWDARNALATAQRSGQPQAAILAGLRGSTSADPATQAVIDGAAGTIGTPHTVESDPAQLYGIRKAIGDALSPLSAKAGSDAQLAASELQQVKAALDNSIEGAAPGFKQGLADYATSSRPIDAMRYLQSKGFTSADGTVTLAKVKGVLDDVAKQQALPGARDAKSLPPATLDSLQSLYADLLRQNNSRLGMQPGSTTFQNLATSNALAGMGAPLAWSASALSRVPLVGNLLTKGIGDAYRAQNEPVLDAVVNRLMNPSAGASITARAAQLQRAAVPRGANSLTLVPGVVASNRLLSGGP